MQKSFGLLFVISIFSAGCGLEKNVETSIEEGGSVGPMVVRVSEGSVKTHPVYTWLDGTDATAMKLSVAPVSNLAAPVWEIQSVSVTDTINSPVIQGSPPGGTAETATGRDLQIAVWYRVTVSKVDSSKNTYRDFRIKP